MVRADSLGFWLVVLFEKGLSSGVKGVSGVEAMPSSEEGDGLGSSPSSIENFSMYSMLMTWVLAAKELRPAVIRRVKVQGRASVEGPKGTGKR